MADFSSNDINDAKRRVEEMRNRARSYIGSPQDNQSQNTNNTDNTGNTEKSNPPPSSNSPLAGLGDIFNKLSFNDDSSLILALVLILSREKADNMLILALLYILL